MRIQRATSNTLESPGLVASKLPPEILDRAVAGLCWVTMFTAVTSVLLTVVEHQLQPEFAKAWQHPALRITSLCVLFLSAAVMVVQRMGWLRKERLLDLGLFFQVAIAFATALVAGGAFAQEIESKAGMPPGNMQMMAMHNQMMAEMKAMDASLDRKVAAMNAAKGRDKVDSMAAVINEMVSQHKQMMAKMMGMHEPVMKDMKDMKDMKGMKDDKSPDSHKEHHE